MKLIYCRIISKIIEQFEDGLELFFPSEFKVVSQMNDGVIDFSINKNDDFIEDFYSNKISNISAICGPNGSGKSNSANNIFDLLTEMQESVQSLLIFSSNGKIIIYFQNRNLNDVSNKFRFLLDNEVVGEIPVDKYESLLLELNGDILQFKSFGKKDGDIYNTSLGIVRYSPNFDYNYRRTYQRETDSDIPFVAFSDKSMNALISDNIQNSVKETFDQYYMDMFDGIYEMINSESFDSNQMYLPNYISLKNNPVVVTRVIKRLVAARRSGDYTQVANSKIDSVILMMDTLFFKVLFLIYDQACEDTSFFDALDEFSIDDYIQLGRNVTLWKNLFLRYLENLDSNYKPLVYKILDKINDNHFYKETLDTGFDLKNPVHKELFYELKALMKDASVMYELFNISTGFEMKWRLYSNIYAGYNEVLKANASLTDILIILDEPETCFHPVWKQTFITELIDFTDFLIGDKKIKVQYLICSNDPVTISDVRGDQCNFLQVKKKDSQSSYPPYRISRFDRDQQNTFGANIYDLYKNNYFIQGEHEKFNSKGAFTAKYLSDLAEELNVLKQEIQNSSYEIVINKVHLLEKRVAVIGDKIIKKVYSDLINEIKIINEYLNRDLDQ
ncbi:hypothetical protein EZV73_23990 [Acidaminobacter sp. JC074]|uniref:hypothetical protein n=1 Tax=Acidaminobacter sp. JC074 TaxID=2530199 RepID=UPI001F0D9FA0|nr:hypothetical protein [Acidaminobacter sp. JC074]MCH4890665.1 hypothetical protein [Acidaminobacter sp. JC074]